MADEQFTDEQYRARSAKTVWGAGDELFKEDPEVKVEKEDEISLEGSEEKTDEDPFAGIDPAVKSYIDSQTGELNNLKYRLSQAENRVGSLQNSLQNQKKAEPPKVEAKKEPVVNKEWEQLKSEYPEEADKFSAMEKVFAGKSAEEIKLPDVEAVRAELQTDFDKKLTDIQVKTELKFLKFFHPDYEKVAAEPEYTAWLTKQPPEIQSKAFESMDAMDAKEVLDLYKGTKKKPVRNTQEKRDERLARSTETPRTGKTIKTKSPDDMTDEEYRRHAARKIYGAST